MTHPTRHTGDAIRVRRDKLGRMRYEPTAQAPDLEQRFIKFQDGVLTRMAETPEAVPVSATLVAFDGICDAPSLTGALEGLAHVCQWHELALIDWSPGGDWRDRRALSVPTQLRLALAAPESITNERAALSLFAQQAVPRWHGLECSTVLDQLFASSRTWSALHLPGVLAAHVRGDCRLQVLTRGAFVREQTRLALAKEVSIAQATGDEMALLDGVMEGRHSPDMSVIQAIGTAAAAIREAKHARARKQLQAQLRTLIPRARQAGAMQSLVLAWALHLVQNGSRIKQRLAPRTLGNYLTQPTKVLAEFLIENGTLPTTSDDYSALYERVLGALSRGQQTNGRSVIALFHDYLVAFHDAPALGITVQADEAPPSANIIWPHEMDRLHRWLEAPGIDRRLARTLQLIFALAYTVRLRTSEVLSLRLRNVTDVHDEIEFAPLIRDGTGKSVAARRTALIDDALRLQLDDWVHFRRAEGASAEDLLFGDPHDPDQGLYRPGAVLLAMRQMLKATTGDERVNFHTLSHTYASRAFERISNTFQATDLNALDQLSADMGHFSAVTLRHYVHSVEGPLRRALDAAIDQCIPMTSMTAARVCDLTPQTLRKRAERARAAGTLMGYYALMLRSAHVPHWPCVSHLHASAEPEPPKWLVQPLSQDPARVLATLIDLAEGVPATVAAQRANIEITKIHTLLRRVLSTLQVIRAWQPRWRTIKIVDEQLGTTFYQWAQSSSGLDFLRARQERFAPIVRQPPDPQGPVIQAWLEGYERRYLALHSEFAQPLLEWLRDAGVSSLCLALSVRADRAQLGKRMATFFHLVFGIRPRIFTHAPGGRARPACYLIWSSARIETARPPVARCSLDGLHAWLLAVACTDSGQSTTDQTEDGA